MTIRAPVVDLAEFAAVLGPAAAAAHFHPGDAHDFAVVRRHTTTPGSAATATGIARTCKVAESSRAIVISLDSPTSTERIPAVTCIGAAELFGGYVVSG